ncbi:hypothetical protein MTR_2g436640 [Medicago truncatula]|uniref:Uncharacterized protein n=1 Tax=Medicago truncatula TaxID=3880 RepID=A0A072V6K4_MEDTR|nr:hypothetical protein MTR_2g436640 [Medicago truncatula]
MSKQQFSKFLSEINLSLITRKGLRTNWNSLARQRFKHLLGNSSLEDSQPVEIYQRGGFLKYIGGVEEIQKLHDDKKLEKLLDRCERIDDIEGGDGGCEACGDIKFVPCETYHKSCKIYYKGDYEEDDNCEVGGNYGLQLPNVHKCLLVTKLSKKILVLTLGLSSLYLNSQGY